VLVLFNRSGSAGDVDDSDVLKQCEAVVEALLENCHQVTSTECTLDLEALRECVLEERPDVVFNLVESLGGTDRLILLVPWLLDSMGIPYTGASSKAILATTNKIWAKQKLRASGLPTPDWVVPYGDSPLLEEDHDRSTVSETFDDLWIVKPIWEHASRGMTDDAVQRVQQGSSAEAILGRFEGAARREVFAERFVDGREFNVSIALGEVLPPVEIDFSSFPAGKPRIVGHKAKWEETSIEYAQTPRRFQFPEKDAPLIKELIRLSSECWQLFQLQGLARVDFRVDDLGQPWILEININPCLSPDAGLAAALENAGWEFPAVIERLVIAAKSSWNVQLPSPKPLELNPPSPVGRRAKGPPIPPLDLRFRQDVLDVDRRSVRRLIDETGLFRVDEVEVAVELVETRLEKGFASGYHFLFAEREGMIGNAALVGDAELIGYACFGPIACTVSSWDLYWIAVRPAQQSQGIGLRLMTEVQRLVREHGGTQMYIDTSDRPEYTPTRVFYQRCGFRIAATLENFYDRNDGKVVWHKML
jgi:D-alanine-D-alanine ligase